VLFGYIPFSIGDILYGIAAVFLLVKVFHFFRFIFSKKRRQQSGEKIRSTLLSVVNVLCVIYLVFNIFWGINYNRKGIAAQIGLEVKKYSVEDLKQINAVLVERINSSRATLDSQHAVSLNNRELFRKVAQAYEQAAKNIHSSNMIIPA
jgi:bacteriorhodopsin